jgi:hypothetical protein
MAAGNVERERKRDADDSEHEVARLGTPEQRRTYTQARRRAAAERDADRLALADEFAAEAPFAIERDRGYLALPPAAFPAAAPVVEEANALLDGIGHEGLLEYVKKPMARGFVPPSAYELDSPYMQLALSRDLVAPVAAYLGVVPVLNDIDVWYSPYHERPPRSSQLWHRDHADTEQIKVWLHCNDIGPDSGPLTIVDAADSDELAARVGYVQLEGRVPDEDVAAVVGPEGLVALTGSRGTVDFVDTSRCFHFGSRVTSPDAPARRVVLIQYLTPYAFEFLSDHREEARYRHLGRDGTLEEIERLVLGAA